MEIVFPNDGGEVVFGDTLAGSCHWLELGEAFRVVDALFKEVEFRFAHSHLAVKSEQALSGIIEGLQAHWLKSEVLRMTPEHIERLCLTLFRVLLVHIGAVTLVLVLDYLFPALVEINVKED